jgi:hypothetical protein
MLVFGRLLARGAIAANWDHVNKAQVAADMNPTFFNEE